MSDSIFINDVLRLPKGYQDPWKILIFKDLCRVFEDFLIPSQDSYKVFHQGFINMLIIYFHHFYLPNCSVISYFCTEEPLSLDHSVIE